MKKWLWSVFGDSICPDTWVIKGKTKQKTGGSRKVTKKKSNSRGHKGRTAVRVGRTAVCPPTTGLAPHHGQPVVGPVLPGPAAPRTTRFVLVLDLDLGLESSRFGPPFAALFGLHASTIFTLDSFTHFSSNTWLESYKSAINIQQAKTSIVGEIGA